MLVTTTPIRTATTVAASPQKPQLTEARIQAAAQPAVRARLSSNSEKVDKFAIIAGTVGVIAFFAVSALMMGLLLTKPGLA